jgi:hypothetical protein
MERTVPGATFWNFIAIAQQGWAWSMQPYGRLDVARNQYAQDLLDSDYTHLLMFDIDHKHPVDVVKRLGQRWLEDPQRLVVGALAFRRGPPFDPCFFYRDDDGRYYSLAEWEQGCLSCDVIGFSAVLFHRSVFERLPKPWFRFDYAKAGRGIWTGEDFAFCMAAREAGIGIYCDTALVTPHLVEQWAVEDTFTSYRQAQAGASLRPTGQAPVDGGK